MKYHESGRFGRITKNIRAMGQADKLADIMPESWTFSQMSPKEKTQYVFRVVKRMETHLGSEPTKAVMHRCGQQCCGKSWIGFVQDIWAESKDLNDFFTRLNHQERAYHTVFSYSPKSRTIEIDRTRCICGLAGNARYPTDSTLFCECSAGHFSEFFCSVFDVRDISLKQSLLAGADSCKWILTIDSNREDDCDDGHPG